ncbi:type IV secretory system conjugative DNA transfer family protein [Nitrosospira multiformis]|uniref:type IV secretory system conjugative DNA transfer family protein n=1 Tax=Nitrosospira multiformis TaxID=1231 RepID=UPI00089473C4|nr:type IV secretory system conjugative DNA transfer family protein [Nitrosospira multiformis]SEA68935.1 type IV secretion system protein VirD4 [Nitrosospira multiformis]
MRPGPSNGIGSQIRADTANRPFLMAALFLLVLVLSLAAATQYFAHAFQYHAALGAHQNFLYAPWKILEWAKLWPGRYGNEFSMAGSVATMTAAIGLILLLALKRHLSGPATSYLHGSARWAGKKDILAAGLLPRNRSFLEMLRGQGRDAAFAATGVYVGAWLDKRGRQHYLRHSGPEHVLCYAPTRSGKGVGLIVPTLLSWGESAVITDLKGELWELTAGWRKQYAGNRVLRFEAASINGGAHWNPLEEIRLGSEHEVGDVQNLATLIVDPDGKGLESHWQKSAQALLVGLILHALYQARSGGRATPSLSDIDSLLSDPNRDIAELWMEMFTLPPLSGPNCRIVNASGRDMMDRPTDEAGSVLSTTKSYLSLYRDPVVRGNISDSHFRIQDLMHHDDPVSLYIVTRPTDKARLRPLIRILLNMIVRLLADRIEFEGGRPKPVYKHRLLMMLDEFPSLGKLEILQESLAFLAGYGIKCYLICQDINQLKSSRTGYGQDESITSNCHIQNAFPPNRVETAEHLSKLTGQTTIVKEQVTKGDKHTSRTLQEVQRSLLTVDECLRMPGPVKGVKDGNDVIEKPGDMIIYVAGFPAIYGRQPLYFKDAIFQKRAEVPAPMTSDRLSTLV